MTSTPVGARTTLAAVLEVLVLAEAVGVDLWLDGGWGVDALLGKPTRLHGDLDVAIEERNLSVFVDGLRRSAFVEVGEDGATAWNFLMARPDGAVVDLHVIVLDEQGNGVLGPAARGTVYPAESLAGRGTLADRSVRCISPEWAVRFHDAYPGDADDSADVRALCERFNLTVPEQYR
ncbi:nucleotidyltransferase domain-containing protein [Kineosporia babensis]|uniref:Aminoglycoside nucleotidyltransferase n=1 Tax=Kineosporia babensis TaxID=499548 RepID=A0A9X1NMK0_9ACTN|nr:hypothetical protein [Kineosporia babensis]MCD5317130.1 hypothetical protein [Kineosporia babensis]